MNKQLHLFDLPKQVLEPISEKNKGKPRLVKACRDQYEMRRGTLDDLLPKDHIARDIWKFVANLDLSLALNKINSVEGSAGRPATDPKILLSLWLLALVKSINSAKLIEEYCKEHDAFKWICGGVNVCDHVLSDFRTAHGDMLERLLIQSVGMLSNSGIISLERISQDGMRVRANAGASSFRSEGTIDDHLILAKELLNDLNEEAKNNPNACKTRIAAAERRAAEEKARKIELANAELNKLLVEKIESKKKQRKKIDEKDLKKTRASTTDAEARIMKMACGGFRPAYNVQYASTNKGKAIVGVDVINQGVDNGQTIKMIQRVKTKYGIVPDSWAVDAGYRSHEQLDLISEQFENCKIYMPVDEDATDPFQKKPNDSKAVGEWRERMGTPEAKIQYKQRAETAEYVNAVARNRGLQQFLVRGLEKVKCVSILYALMHNMTIFLNNQ